MMKTKTEFVIAHKYGGYVPDLEQPLPNTRYARTTSLRRARRFKSFRAARNYCIHLNQKVWEYSTLPVNHRRVPPFCVKPVMVTV